MSVASARSVDVSTPALTVSRNSRRSPGFASLGTVTDRLDLSVVPRTPDGPEIYSHWTKVSSRPRPAKQLHQRVRLMMMELMQRRPCKLIPSSVTASAANIRQTLSVETTTTSSRRKSK